MTLSSLRRASSGATFQHRFFFFLTGWSFLRSIPNPESPVPTSALQVPVPVPGAGFKRYQVPVAAKVPGAGVSLGQSQPALHVPNTPLTCRRAWSLRVSLKI